MMNGSAGYEYGGSYTELGAQLDSLTSAQQSPKGSAAYRAPPAGGPSSSAYDPTVAGLQNAAQHQLLVAASAMTAAAANCYAQAQHHQQQAAAQQQQQRNNLTFLGAASVNQSQTGTVGASFASGVQNYDHHLPIQGAVAGNTSAYHERRSSFDDLLMLHPSLISGLSPLDPFTVQPAVQPPVQPLQVLSNTAPVVPSSVPSSTLSSSKHDELLVEIKLEVPSVSLEPLSGNQVVERLEERMDDVLTKYIPCVNFLVQCQQDLRKGLEFATQRQRSSGYSRRSSQNMSSRQFFSVYIDQLPNKFYMKNQYQMESKALNEAFQGLQKLRQDAKNCERQGCDAVKSSFLGGMKDGESWGLRKWLSKNGNALRVCTDLECILHACQKLDRAAESTVRLGEILRPLADRALKRLRNNIPSSYQQHSSAHPYLPFFHRLESALRGVSAFDPEDDDVICIDSDDEDDVVEVVQSAASASFKPPPKAQPKKRKRESAAVEIDDTDIPVKQQPKIHEVTAQPATNFRDDDSSSGESECESVIEIVNAKPSVADDLRNGDDWTCASCSMVNAASSTCCLACGEESLMKDLVHIPALEDFLNRSKSGTPASFDSSNFRWGSESNDELLQERREPLWPIPIDNTQTRLMTARNIADKLDKLADFFDQNQQAAIRPPSVRCASFWDGERYARALRLFGDLLRRPHSLYFLEQVDEDRLIEAGNQPFSHVIKHPICFRDIAVAILGDELQVSKGNDGRLPVRGISWNMWKGAEFFQAIDLVFLNSLAYGKALDQGRSHHRSQTNKIRKELWNGIHDIVGEQVMRDVELRKLFTPTRRAESSGFVVYKINHSS